MPTHDATPLALAKSAWTHRHLILQLSLREVQARYKGSVFGLLWSFITPLFMLAVYTFVFSVIFQARWGLQTGSKAEFALVLFSGLIVFNIFSEVSNKSPTLITSNPSYVTKIPFPLEVLSIVAVLSALIQFAISLFAWLLAYTLLIGPPQATILLLPAFLLPLVLLTLGLSWLASSLGVYLRDLNQFVGLATSALMFLSPIFYPITAVPEAYRPVMQLNPLTAAIEQCRSILFAGEIPNLRHYAALLAFAVAVCLGGFAWFQRTRRGFADVI